MTAPIHPKQDARIDALRSYEILDTDREKDFDDIVALAAAICGAPISVINFIDTDRQWFKAETGLGMRETPLDTSICSHVILERDFVEIHDTLADPRTTDNPLCHGTPGVRFYAGALLWSDTGLPLGTLCILDHVPRHLTPLQRDAIRVLARQVMAQLEMRKSIRTASLLRKEVDHRVKNSLQSLAALVRIQSRQAVGDEAIAALDTVISRIGAVATLHEELYRTEAGPVIDLADYVANLSRHFAAIAPANVSIELSLDPVKVSSLQAVAVGTLINESVANAFKHAFPDARHGTVHIAIAETGGGSTVRVTCADDGVGLPTEPVPDSGGLGMKIAQIICAELQSKLEVQSSRQGLSLSMEFTKDLPEADGA